MGTQHQISVSKFLKSEPDFDNTEVVEPLIIEALLCLFLRYGLDQEPDSLLDPNNWAHEELEVFEAGIEGLNPEDLLPKILMETDTVTQSIKLPFMLKLNGLSKKEIRRSGMGQLHSYQGRGLFNIDDKYSSQCALLALNILIPMFQSEDIELSGLILATKLVQTIPHCDLLNAHSIQVLAEKIRTDNQETADKITSDFDEKDHNPLKKRIAQQITLDYFWKDQSQSLNELIKASSPSIEEAMDTHPDIPVDHGGISPSVSKRWITEIWQQLHDEIE